MTGFDGVNQLLLFFLHEIPIRLCASPFKSEGCFTMVTIRTKKNTTQENNIIFMFDHVG
jgi:hypothetical protein